MSCIRRLPMLREMRACNEKYSMYSRYPLGLLGVAFLPPMAV